MANQTTSSGAGGLKNPFVQKTIPNEYIPVNPNINKRSTPAFIPNSISTVDYVETAAIASEKIAKALQESLVQGGATVGLTFYNTAVSNLGLKAKQYGTYTNEDLNGDPDLLFIKKLIFGNEPIKDLATRIAEGEKTAKKWGIPSGGPTLGGRLGGLAAPIGVIGMVGLDFTGIGGRANVIKTLAKMDDIADTAKFLSKIGVADDLIKSYAPIFAATKNTDDIARGLDSLIDLQKTTKLTGGLLGGEKKLKPLIDFNKNELDDALRAYPQEGIISRDNQLRILVGEGNDIPIYRATNKTELSSGDFVTTERDVANNYSDMAGSPVKEFRVPKKDLSIDGVTGDLVYTPTPFAETKGGLLLQEKLGSKGLTGEFKKLETSGFSQIAEGEDLLKKQYRDKFGKVIGVDDVRTLIRGYDGSNSVAVHEPSSYLAKIIYNEDLIAKRGLGNNKVVFTAGGTGTGKTTAIKNIDEVAKIWNEAPIVYDGNLSNYKSAVEKIEKALDNNFDVNIFYIDRDVAESFAQGVLPRATETGRVVPIKAHINTHVGSRETLPLLIEKYKNNPRVQIRAIDNNRGFGKAVLIDDDKILQTIKPYTANELNKLEKQLYDETVKQFNEGRISKKTFSGIIGEYGQETINIKQTATKAEKVVAETKTRKFLETVRNARPDIKLRIGGQYIVRNTDKLYKDAVKLIKTDFRAAEKMALTQTDDKAVAVGCVLIKHYGDEAMKVAKEVDKEIYWEKASYVAHTLTRNLTEQGQSIQAASVLGRLTPEGLLRTAAREVERFNRTVPLSRQIQNLTAKQTGYILSEAKKIENMADGMAKAMAFQKLNEYIASLIPTPFYKKILGLWKAGLLTGIKTSGLNTASNLFHGVSEGIKDIPAVAFDSVASLITGKRTMALTLKGWGSGGKEGFENGWRYLKTGFDERNLAVKLDYTKVNFGKGKVAKALQAYEEGIFRIMGAEDQPFYYGAKAHSLQSQALAAAKNKGLRGPEAQKFIDNLLKGPTDEMLRYAVADAEMSVFQNKTALASAAQAVKNVKGIVGTIGELAIPFSRTPSAVAMQLVNYSPVGMVKEIAYQIAKGTFDQRKLAQAFGRSVVGTGVAYIGAELFKKKFLNLGYPKTEKERKLWELEGRTPNSFYDPTAKKWRSVAVLGPLGMTLITGGYFQQDLEKTGSPMSAAFTAMAGGVKSLGEQTFLRGMNQLVDWVSDPEQSGMTYPSNLISSFVPTLIGDVAKSIDPYERRTSKGLLDKAISKIPFLRQKLEPQINVLGQERTKAAGWLATMIDPSRPSIVLSSPVVSELRRLKDAGYDVSPTLLGDKEGYKSLTPEQNTALWQKAGELLNNKLQGLVQLRQYQELSDKEKDALVRAFVDKAFMIAKVSAVLDLTAGKSPEEVKAILGKLKGDLLTKEVLTEYLKMK
jgi:hypothetical protein